MKDATKNPIKKSYTILIKDLGPSLIAMYEYTDHIDPTPVICMDTIDFGSLKHTKSLLTNKKFIMLTQDDIDNGADIFPIQFLHIQKVGTCIHGTDIISNISLDKKDMQTALESKIRHSLINIRENFLSHKEPVIFIRHLIASLYPLWYGIAHIIDLPFSHSDPHTISTLHHHIGIPSDHIDILLLLHHIHMHSSQIKKQPSPYETIDNIHAYLQILVQRVDTYTLVA